MPLTIGEERAPAGEDEVIAELVALQLKMMQHEPTRRGQHAKHHGCVDASFVVRDDIPEQYRLGFFKEPRAYAARVRWSNGRTFVDTEPDIHGMAVKVFGVTGARALEGVESDEQDFILIDSQVFFARDVKTLLDVMKARASPDPAAMKEFAQHDAAALGQLKAALKTVASPLTAHYWSTVPYKLGGGAVKYTAIPAADNGLADAQPASDSYLRAAMVTRLSEGNTPVVFDLCVIPQTDPDRMPIEDPTRPWESEPVPVATITVAPQTFDTPERMSQCEAASFDPWHALAEHRPLGGINRARRAVYPASVLVRRTPRAAAT